MRKMRLGAGLALVMIGGVIGAAAIGVAVSLKPIDRGTTGVSTTTEATLAADQVLPPEWEAIVAPSARFHPGLRPADPSGWLRFSDPSASAPTRLACGCFAPGTPDDVIQNWFDHMVGEAMGQTAYNLLCRWSGTNGSPRALTWSFAPDGLNIPSVIGEPSGSNELFSRMDALFGGNRALWIAQFQSCFDRWEALCGTSYTRLTVPGQDWDDGASWGSSGSTFRGDIRIGMKNIDGGSNTLAYNQFPCSSFAGDMVLDRAEGWNSSFGTYRFLRNTVMHEHGHGLGLLHVCPQNGTKLMEPGLNTGFDGPRQDDIRAAMEFYGDPFESDNNTFNANDIGTLLEGSPVTVGLVPAPSVAGASILSIDANGEEDYFKFQITDGQHITVTVTPIGTFYDSSDQLGNGSCASGNFVNAVAIANLAVDVLDTDQVTLLGSSDDAGTGLVESLEVDALTAGQYYIRVYETSTPTETQMYRLTVGATALDPCLLVECDDGVFCNGEETCSDGDCFPGTPPCTGEQICNEDSDICQTAPGGCCLPDGSCEILAEQACASAAGFYYGNGSDCLDLDPPCLPADALMYCTPDTNLVFPGQSVDITVFLEDVDSLATYQTTALINQISGSGSVTIDCSSCTGGANEADCGVRVDEDRADYVFEGANGFAAVNCDTQSGGAVLISGSVSVPAAPPSYLIEYTLDISPDATVGSEFEFVISPDPVDTFLIAPGGAFVGFQIGASCTLTIADAGDCLEPVVTADGSKTILIEPQGGALQALRVDGAAGDPEVGCVSAYVQADGTLGPNPVFMLPDDWGVVGAHGLEIIPEETYDVQAECGGDFSPIASATTWKWGDVEAPPNNNINFADIFLVVQAFQQNFSNVTLERADLEPCSPNRIINLADVQQDVFAFQGQSYTDVGCPIPCP